MLATAETRDKRAGEPERPAAGRLDQSQDSGRCGLRGENGVGSPPACHDAGVRSGKIAPPRNVSGKEEAA